MLTHPTLDLLHQLGLNGMAKAFGEIEASAEATTLTHPEWLGLLLDQEVSYRRDRRLLARLRYARLRHQASVDMRHPVFPIQQAKQSMPSWYDLGMT